MVKKYIVLFEYSDDYITTSNWGENKRFTSKKEFDDYANSDTYKFISLILESEKEFDE